MTPKRYCRECRFYIPMWDGDEECATSPTIDEDGDKEYAIPQERNKNNDCPYFSPKLWVTIRDFVRRWFR